MTKIAIYAIAKDEEKHVDRWYTSVKDADHIFVVDTGSTDNTVNLLRGKQNLTCLEASFHPFRFDLARNFILNQIPEEYEWCIFLDLDEVLEENWRERVEDVISKHPKATSFNTRFVYELSADHSPSITYKRQMIHRNKQYVWYYPVHELLKHKDNSDVYVDTSILAYHYPDNNKPRTSYLSLLELSAQENPDDPRAISYLAREYMFHAQYAKAIMYFEKHLQIESVPILRSETYRYMANCHIQRQENISAERCYFRAIAEAPNHREPWGECAHFYLKCRDYESCLGMISGMLRVTYFPQDSVIRKDEYYGSWPYHVGAVCYYNIDSNKLAIEYIKEAYRLSPRDPYVISDYATITNSIPIGVAEMIAEKSNGNSNTNI